MRNFLLFAALCLAVHLSVAPPVAQKKKDGQLEENEVDDTEMAGITEYRRYLKEVIQALESDPDFRAKLEKVDQEDINTGKIADQLEFVNHKVRTKLDELKREELERLRHLAIKRNQLMNGLHVDRLKIAEHIDHTNTRTFEIEDLKKLIAKTTKDLAEADRRRQEEFKQYEMQRKFDEQEKLKHMTDEDRRKYEDELKMTKEQSKKHEPVHHPGSKQQLKEVWEKQDHMDSEDFNPKTFFFLHDLDGNGVWDHDEVKALFLKELDKLYAQGTPQGDLLKRREEMERMREHVFIEADLNKDGLISYDEFLEQTKKPDFQQDEGWEGLDEQQIYTQEEFDAFEKHMHEELQKEMQQHGQPQMTIQQHPREQMPVAQHLQPQVPVHRQSQEQMVHHREAPHLPETHPQNIESNEIGNSVPSNALPRRIDQNPPQQQINPQAVQYPS